MAASRAVSRPMEDIALEFAFILELAGSKA